MITFKIIKMIRYLARIDEGEELLDKEIWYVQKTLPDLPYYKIRIKIIKRENRFIQDRPKKRRFFKFGV